MTLDAGGTNLVFGAIKSCEYIVEPISLPSHADSLERCLKTIVQGFSEIKLALIEKGEPDPAAISFAFPGPADYPNGIIGGFLPNFPCFRDGVALGPYLSKLFGIPVYINNDGDLFTYGEALVGALPEINSKLKEKGSAKQYRNLIGYTLGTGFGIGTFIGGELNRGDNSCVETFCLPHPFNKDVIVEDGVAIRAVKRVYAEKSGINDPSLEPKDISDIYYGRKDGDKEAARLAFYELGRVAGEAMATAATIIDGLIVIGGGIMNSSELIVPGILDSMRSKIRTLSGEELDRVQMKVYNLDDETEFDAFAKGEAREINIFGMDETVVYDPQKRIGIIKSRLGASKAISLGAYVFALSQIDRTL